MGTIVDSVKPLEMDEVWDLGTFTNTNDVQVTERFSSVHKASVNRLYDIWTLWI